MFAHRHSPTIGCHEKEARGRRHASDRQPRAGRAARSLRRGEGAGQLPHANREDRAALRAGDTRAYGPGVLHSTLHPEKAWVIRVTGTDLDAIPRYRFRPKTDKIVEKV